MADIKDAIRDNAAGPKKVEGDTGSVEQHRITDQIAADRYLASQTAVTRRKRGLRFDKLAPPGAV